MEISLRRAASFLAFALLAAAPVGAQQPPAGGGAGRQGGPPAPPMMLTSTAYKDSMVLPTKYTCSATPSAVSPPLQWVNAPAATVSFTLIFHDLEPRAQRGFADNLHWLIWNIPAATKELAEGVPVTAEFPDGTRQLLRQQQAATIGYQGPCPPMGVALPHHYVFDLYALDTKLELPATAPRADVEAAINGHIIGHAVLVGLFNR